MSFLKHGPLKSGVQYGGLVKLCEDRFINKLLNYVELKNYILDYFKLRVLRLHMKSFFSFNFLNHEIFQFFYKIYV